MALLAHKSKEQKDRIDFNVDLPLEKGIPICLSIDKENRWFFTNSDTVQECLGQIIRADNGFYVIVAEIEKAVKVNHVPVFGLHVLRDTDCIKTEQEELWFYEWIRQEITVDSRLVGVPCAFCTVTFVPGDPVMFCPKCDTPMHEACWIARKDIGEGCIEPNCGYMPPRGDPYVAGSNEQRS